MYYVYIVVMVFRGSWKSVNDIFYVCIVWCVLFGGAYIMCGMVCFYWGLHAYY